MTGYLKTAMATALLCGAAVLTVPASAASMGANSAIGNVGVAKPDQAHPANASAGSTEATEQTSDSDNDAASNEDSDNDSDDMASNEEDESDGDSSLHAYSSSTERAATADLNQAQLSANGQAGAHRTGVAGHGDGNAASRTNASERTTDQDNDAEDSEDSDNDEQ